MNLKEGDTLYDGYVKRIEPNRVILCQTMEWRTNKQIPCIETILDLHQK